MDGWQLVPKEPTDEMLAAYKSFYRSGNGLMDISVYKAILAAAPKPPIGICPDCTAYRSACDGYCKRNPIF